jgi:hypothetical protein
MRIPPGRSPEGAPAPEGSCPVKNAVHDALGVQGRRSPPGARGYRGPPLSGPLSVGDITKSGVLSNAGVYS